MAAGIIRIQGKMQNMEKTTNKQSSEFIARGVCVREGMILLCRNIKHGNVYLLGGHVEFGEAANKAVEREMIEETGLVSRATRFLAAVQSRFTQRGTDVFELNLLFELEIESGANPAAAPRSLESDIEFFWHPLSDVAQSGLLPASIVPRLEGWLDGTDPVRFIPPER